MVINDMKLYKRHWYNYAIILCYTKLLLICVLIIIKNQFYFFTSIYENKNHLFFILICKDEHTNKSMFIFADYF